MAVAVNLRRHAIGALVLGCVFAQGCGRGCPAIAIHAIDVQVTHADGTPDPDWAVSCVHEDNGMPSCGDGAGTYLVRVSRGTEVIERTVLVEADSCPLPQPLFISIVTPDAP